MSVLSPHAGEDDPQNGTVSQQQFRRVMASFVTGVTVLTTQSRGEVRGMTANAFMSGSLDPPLCVISVGLTARMHTFLVEAGHFGVNILARGQEPLIGHFSGHPIEELEQKYEYADRTPLFAHAYATLAAKVIARHACGRHDLVDLRGVVPALGEDVACDVEDLLPSLGFSHGSRCVWPAKRRAS